MKSSPYRVHYPNGSRVVRAISPADAEAIAMRRWGTPPTYVERLSEGER